MPGISIIVIAHEQCDALRRNLPIFLNQEYPSDFEVIVVDMNSTDETLAMLESMQVGCPQLHIIRMPDSARNVSPTRLALTLGIRAAANDWVVLTQADCRPASLNWLSRLAEVIKRQPDAKIILGYTRFVNGHGWHGLRCRFFRAWQQLLHLKFVRRHAAYRADGTNLCYSRSLFLKHRGFADHANLLAGATDIMVNHNSTSQNTAVCLHPDAVMLQQAPRYRRWWDEERLFFMETRHHFHNTFSYRMLYLSKICQIWLCTLLLIANVICGIMTANYTIMGLFTLLILLYLGYRIYSFNRELKSIGEPPIVFALPLLFHLIPLWDIIAWLRWRFTNKQVFQKKFI